MGRPIPRLLMHPVTPELVGVLLDDPRFGRNKNLFIAFLDVCSEHGGGYVDYLWPKPTPDGLTEDQLKISYVELFKPWNWVIGTGVYIDDIEAESKKRFEAILDELQQTFSKVKMIKSGYLFLITKDKEVLLHPVLERHTDGSTLNPRRSMRRSF